MTRAIAHYPFQGNPALSQLSFPVGATIDARSRTNQGGWIYGSYQGQHGWFPVSYVELQLHPNQHQQRPGTPIPPQQQSRKSVPQQQQQQQQPKQPSQQAQPISPNTVIHRNRAMAVDITPSILSPISFDVIDEQDENPFLDSSATDNDMPVMGGIPGSLLDSTQDMPPYTPEDYGETVKPPPMNEPEEAEKPVDIYRHSQPTKKNQNYRQEYTGEISISVTNKPRSSTPPRSNRQVAPTPHGNPEAFWKAHPGRTGGPANSQLEYIDRSFAGLKGDDKIVFQESPKKSPLKKFNKKLKKMAHNLKLQQ